MLYQCQRIALWSSSLFAYQDTEKSAEDREMLTVSSTFNASLPLDVSNYAV
jgi:hypothetical protein